MLHEFHFVLKENQKLQVKAFAKEMKMSNSKAVNYIIKIMKPFLERYFYYCIKDSKSEYQRFSAEEHLHIKIDERNYNLIKHITDNMYIFSMAITLRKILEIFFKLLEKIGLSKVIEKLKNIRYLHLRKANKIKAITKNTGFRQLSNFRRTSDEIYRYHIGFSKNYTVVNFNFH